MSAHLYCCPICSLLSPPGVFFTPPQMNGACAQPAIWRGRRSGRFFLVRRLSCPHGPPVGAVEIAETEAAIVGPWNEWAEREARAKAERLQFTPDRVAQWLYQLGIGPVPGMLA